MVDIRCIYGIKLIIIIFSTLALAVSGEGPALNIVGVMIFWHVVLGTGVGGGYALSSIITSEFATVKWRGAMMAAVFANQRFGQFTCAMSPFSVLWASGIRCRLLHVVLIVSRLGKASRAGSARYDSARSLPS